MSYHIDYKRAGDPDEKLGRDNMLYLSAKALIFTEVLFGIAVAAFAVSIGVIVFNH